MEEQRFANDEIEIDLLEIAGVLWRKAKIIVLCFIVGAVIAGGVTHYAITPQYTGSSMIYILTKTTSVTSLADIQLGEALTTDFSMLVTSRPTLETVIEELGMDYTPEELTEMVTVENPSDTRFLRINVESPDPQEAADIANELATATADRVAEIMNTDRPTIVEKAIVPEKPSSPNLIKNTLLGALIGLVLSMGVIIVRYLLDDTIKTEDDVRKYLNLNTLAALPIDDKAEVTGTGKKTKKKTTTHRPKQEKRPQARSNAK